MQRTHSHHTIRGDFAPLQNIDALDETTLRERGLRRLEGLLLRAVVTASYGGAGLVEALMRGARSRLGLTKEVRSEDRIDVAAVVSDTRRRARF